jgi:hypothetical protein
MKCSYLPERDWLYVLMTPDLRESLKMLIPTGISLRGAVRGAEEFNLSTLALWNHKGQAAASFDDFTVDFRLKEFRLVTGDGLIPFGVLKDGS